MKLQLLIITVILYSSQSLFAQKIFDIEADLIGVEDEYLTFFKKTENNKFEKFQISIEVKNDSNFSIEKSGSIVDKPQYQDEVIKVNDLLNFNENELQKKINNNTFIKKVNKTYRRNRYDNLYIFKNYNNRGLLTLDKYELKEFIDPQTKQKFPKWNFYNRVFLKVCYLKINSKKTIAILVEPSDVENIEGFILPTKTTLISIHNLSGFKSFSNSIVEKNKTNLDYLKLPKNNEKSKIKYKQDLYKISTSFELKDAFNRTLIDKKFDTLSTGNGFIIGEIKGELKIYNYKLIDITPANVRAVFSNENGYCQVLVNNEIKWLSFDGKLSADFKSVVYGVCGFVNNSSYAKKQSKKTLRGPRC